MHYNNVPQASLRLNGKITWYITTTSTSKWEASLYFWDVLLKITHVKQTAMHYSNVTRMSWRLNGKITWFITTTSTAMWEASLYFWDVLLKIHMSNKLQCITVTSHGRHDVSMRWQRDCLSNHLFMLTPKKYQTPHHWLFVKAIHWRPTVSVMKRASGGESYFISWCLNWSPPGAAYMRQWTGSALV